MYKKCVKRFFDIIIGLIGSVFFILVFIVFAPIIHYTDGGPVLFNGERLGYKCKSFKMFKFRSMYVNAPDLRNQDGSTFNSNFDSRVTRIGRFLRKTSLDEVPQFLNVLIGDMSFVGPRPGTTDSEITESERIRRTVRPGITGYSQAFWRNSDTMDERMKNDCFYAENASFIFDCKIVIKTIASVLIHKDIYRN